MTKILAPKGWSTKPYDKMTVPTQSEYEAMPVKYKAMVVDNGGYLTAQQDEDYRFDLWCDRKAQECYE